MSKKLQTFLKWAGTNKKRWALAIGSLVIIILSLSFGVFLILSGYDKEKGLYKTPVDTKLHLKKGIE